MASRYLQNDSPALKRKSARFTESGASALLIFLAEDDAKAAPQRALRPLVAVFFYFSKNNP